MKKWGFLYTILISIWLILSTCLASGDTINLPSLGDSSSGIISQQKQYELGQLYLKSLRRTTPTLDDPPLKSYLEELLLRLAEVSELQDHRLTTLLINDQTINAFAAPGGIIGVNTGLFIHAKTEGQFAAVLAHELAHLSQRHYARMLEESQNQQLPITASLLASILLLAVGAHNAAIAATYSTVAGIESKRLSFSRDVEREADDTGIKTLAHAGFDPQSMPNVFEEMSKANRYNQAPLAFLSTHPVTENRIADARARADQIHIKAARDSSVYHLMQMRAIVFSADNLNVLLQRLTKDLEIDHTNLPDVARYGIIMTATKLHKFATANKQISILLKKAPYNLYYIMAKAKVDQAEGKTESALKQVNLQLDTYSNYYPLLSMKADILSQQKKYKEARDILLILTNQRPTDSDIWYKLAEAQGQAQNIIGLHQARSEFYFLTGDFDQAIQHIKYAQKLAGKNYMLQEKLKKKLADLNNYHKQANEAIF